MEEYIEVLDENGNKTGIVKTRKDVHKDGDWHKVAFIFVVNDKGEIILQKRSQEKETNPNLWTASASGHISVDDSDIEGAIRELEEEIGIKAKADDLQYLFTAKYIRDSADRKVRHIEDVYVLYRNVNINELILQKEEVSEVKYVHFKDFEKMLNDHDKELVPHDEIYGKVVEKVSEKFNGSYLP